MKCPKCGYLGFQAVDRCRNCGFDFSFTPVASVPELAMRQSGSDAMQPLEDLVLVDAASRGRSTPATDPATQLDRSAASERNRTIADLPLFGPSSVDDEPMITRPSPPRQPLSVRRATPEVPRIKTEARPTPSGASRRPTPMLDLEPAEITRSSTNTPVLSQPRGSRAVAQRAPAIEPAALGSRILAVVVDLLILVVTDIAVIYFTMKICGLTPDDLGVLPKGPLIAFLLVQNGGYLVAFTAGGQTLGKMAARIRVVSSDPGGSVDLGHSLVRTLVWAVLAIPAGLGFLSALFNREHRGLHDRCAGTRVVRATA